MEDKGKTKQRELETLLQNKVFIKRERKKEESQEESEKVHCSV